MQTGNNVCVGPYLTCCSTLSSLTTLKIRKAEDRLLTLLDVTKMSTKAKITITRSSLFLHQTGLLALSFVHDAFCQKNIELMLVKCRSTGATRFKSGKGTQSILREGKGREGKAREGKGREGKGREGKGREGKVSPVVLDVLPRPKRCVLQNCLCQIHSSEEDVDV